MGIIKDMAAKFDNVGEAMDAWLQANGISDPRPMLDGLFHSYLFTNDPRGHRDYSEMREWCDDRLGREHWHRSFNKFWFTGESELVMFKLAWGGE